MPMPIKFKTLPTLLMTITRGVNMKLQHWEIAFMAFAAVYFAIHVIIGFLGR